ncbi:MAG TPA: biliverdin-producing heme oxygenase [Luteibacter sp.]|uniref:biliverdin-producing heme oxygenase n=1 Tax=Luteibacter sp. TaxID=1886636 RepID=UPI002B65E197|nr:biliverdin-producing heme oxygenase [Luteibacter sp.]HVI55368.1 biliverdin-producing heme oxygenase [Luteibacter sp.]
MAGAVGSTPAHLLLREATRDAHEAAEATAGMRLLLAGELDDRGYAGLLRAQLGLFDAWEAGRRDWLAGLTEWRYVSRAALIEADLSAAAPIADESAPTQDMRRRSVGADFVGDESTPTQDPHRRSVGADFVGDEAAYWGELYVVEGSALGGRVIVRRLRELYPELPHHFYAVGENAPAGWRRFQSLLDRALPDEASQEAATLGAQRMFARFQQMLKDPAAHD